MLGPLYHLFSEEDKKKALSEAIRVTKKSGIVFVAYCINEGTILMWGFRSGHILDYHFTIYERPDLVGATHHSLDIFRKMG